MRLGKRAHFHAFMSQMLPAVIFKNVDICGRELLTLVVKVIWCDRAVTRKKV